MALFVDRRKQLQEEMANLTVDEYFTHFSRENVECPQTIKTSRFVAEKKHRRNMAIDRTHEPRPRALDLNMPLEDEIKS
jgi:2-succinyl-5-enolpyruvyl-6-hydroxy-3-cyclohexene-1-carboxylate synthase